MGIKKISEKDVVAKELGGGSYLKELLTGSSVGSKKAMLGISVFTPSFVSKKIVHKEDELAYVLRGRGKLITPDGIISYEEGDALYIPAGTPHIVLNDSDSILSMLFFFTYPEYPPTEVQD